MRTPPEIIWFCPKCKEDGEEPYNEIICNDICPKHKVKMQEKDISSIDYFVLKNISREESFIEAMIKLKQDDIIEYQSRMSQFKANLSQQQVVEQKSSNTQSNQRTCKFCGSTSFTPVKRKWSPLMGFLTNKTDLVCNNCGKKVQWIDR